MASLLAQRCHDEFERLRRSSGNETADGVSALDRLVVDEEVAVVILQFQVRDVLRRQRQSIRDDDGDDACGDRKSTRLNQSRGHLVCRLLLEKKKKRITAPTHKR